MAKKRRKKLERTRLRAKCIELAKTVAKTRDGYTCQRCGKDSSQRQIHGSHVHPVTEGSMLAVDPMNIKALCARCHFWWHEHPIDAADWFNERFSDRREYLDTWRIDYRAMGTIPIQWWRDRKEELTRELEEMQG